MPESLRLIDPEGDTLYALELAVMAFGEPRLCVEVAQEGHHATMHLTVATATQLRDFLADFIERNK